MEAQDEEESSERILYSLPSMYILSAHTFSFSHSYISLHQGTIMLLYRYRLWCALLAEDLFTSEANISTASINKSVFAVSSLSDIADFVQSKVTDRRSQSFGERAQLALYGHALALRLQALEVEKISSLSSAVKADVTLWLRKLLV